MSSRRLLLFDLIVKMGDDRAMLISYLHKLKNPNWKTGRYVLGNESGDLDSIACALCYGYYLGSEESYVPILNFSREEVKLRPEFVFLMQELHIAEEELFFKEDMSHVEELVLVDHHTLALGQKHLASQVVEIVDHHSGKIPEYPHLVQKECVTVGSLASVVGSKLPAGEWPEDCARLLYSAILLDTKNGSDPHKTTPLDEKMLQHFALRLRRKDREEDFIHLQNLKDSLGPKDWLYKDLKSYGEDPFFYGIASAPSFEGLAVVFIEELRKKRGFSALFLFETATKKLTLYAPDSEVFSRFLKRVPFQLLKKEQGMAHFQCPIESARKTIQPML